MGSVDQAKTRKNGKGHQGEVTERKKKKNTEHSRVYPIPDRALGDIWDYRK